MCVCAQVAFRRFLVLQLFLSFYLKGEQTKFKSGNFDESLLSAESHDNMLLEVFASPK